MLKSAGCCRHRSTSVRPLRMSTSHWDVTIVPAGYEPKVTSHANICAPPNSEYPAADDDPPDRWAVPCPGSSHVGRLLLLVPLVRCIQCARIPREGARPRRDHARGLPRPCPHLTTTASPGRIHCPRRPASRGTLRFPHRQGADEGAERRALPVESLQPQAQRRARCRSAPHPLVRRDVADSSPSWARAPAGRTTVGRPRPDLGKPRSSLGAPREARHQTHPTNQTPAGSEDRRTRARPSKTPQPLGDSRSRKSPAPASRLPSAQSRTGRTLRPSGGHDVAMDASTRHGEIGSAESRDVANINDGTMVLR